jgi:hypothetical protein
MPLTGATRSNQGRLDKNPLDRRHSLPTMGDAELLHTACIPLVDQVLQASKEEAVGRGRGDRIVDMHGGRVCSNEEARGDGYGG